MPDTAINLQAKLSGFSEHWSPRVVAEMNDYQFKLAKILGEFVWHAHEETDEVFIVLSGEMTLEFRDRAVPLARCTWYPGASSTGPSPAKNAASCWWSPAA
ncbi:cupin domain-containing protein [Pseudoxanthomonas mexicana]|uniref:cupin domain-containing protein n=1 Tax=Pseudoxanthomonas mexicana TaxID=128785 RepID=UPI00209DF81B|nr:cupin domain-containing protein [Pseudoxanthomonas mexicana]MCP1584550.1 mannose-6-phosphate isomerase-like protein (cupin superfamily) [Pseudoxanthomonas mexicana]